MDTQELLSNISETARPSYFAEIDELAATAEGNGWTASSLAAAVNSTLSQGSGTGWAVVQLRKLANTNTKKQTNKSQHTAGPCTIGCDYGWLPSNKNPAAVVPCPSCRPDTYRRVNERELARARGASNDQLTAIMLDTLEMARTYPVESGA